MAAYGMGMIVNEGEYQKQIQNIGMKKSRGIKIGITKI